MQQMYKVFYDSQCIYFDRFINRDRPEQVIKEIEYQTDEQFLEEFHEWMHAPDKADLLVLSDVDNKLRFRRFLGLFKEVKAAGGVVMNENREILFIRRLGHWDFPKGHLDPGEAAEAGALREVAEETAAGPLTILRPLPDTHHLYKEHHKIKIKHTRWFLMHCAGKPVLVPQRDEGISEAAWIGSGRLDEVLAATFRSVNEVLGPEISAFRNKRTD